MGLIYSVMRSKSLKSQHCLVVVYLIRVKNRGMECMKTKQIKEMTRERFCSRNKSTDYIIVLK